MRPRLALRYLGSGVRRYAYLGKNLLYYLLPLGAGAVFVFTVVNVLDADLCARGGKRRAGGRLCAAGVRL